jgi:hypothetical protein
VSVEVLSPAYLAALAGQIGSLSAFLGGFAATFLALLLTMERDDRLGEAAIGCAAGASALFVAAVVACTGLTAMLHPEAPARVAGASTALARGVMTGAFGLGTLLLLAALGLSGWMRSRRLGRITSAASGAGALLVLALAARVG